MVPLPMDYWYRPSCRSPVCGSIWALAYDEIIMIIKHPILHDWLTAEEWRRTERATLDIPPAVISSLRSFLASEQLDHGTPELCQLTLSALFRHYRKPARAHIELLGNVLIKLGSCARPLFWAPAVDLLNMAPDLGRDAIAVWRSVLQLDPDEQGRLRTELFHAMR